MIKKIIFLALLPIFSLSDILDKSFYMEYIIKIRGHNKGAIKIEHKKNLAQIEYFNIDKNDDLPFFYKTKSFEYKKHKSAIATTAININKTYSIKYNINKDEADEYNIALIDVKSTSAIKNDTDDEISANFSKSPLNTIEGLILNYMYKQGNKNNRIWLYEPQSNILFHTGIIKEQKTTINIKNKKFKVTKLTIGRISHDNKQKIPLFDIYKYKDLVLSIKSSSSKWEMLLDGIGKDYQTRVQKISSWIRDRERKKMETRYPEAQIETNSRFNNGAYEVTFNLVINDENIVKHERNLLYSYLQTTSLQDLRKSKGKVFKSVNEQEVCNYIKSTDEVTDYSKDCKYIRTNREIAYDIKHINKALEKNKKSPYSNCSIKDSDDIRVSKKTLECVFRNKNTKKVSPHNVGRFVFATNFKARETKQHKYKYKQTVMVARQEVKFHMSIKQGEETNNYHRLIKNKAGFALSRKFFDKDNRQIKYDKYNNLYGFSVDNKKFRKYICNKTYEGLPWKYTKQCEVKGHTKRYTKKQEQTFINKTLNNKFPILKLINRTPKRENGEIEFKSLEFPKEKEEKFRWN